MIERQKAAAKRRNSISEYFTSTPVLCSNVKDCILRTLPSYLFFLTFKQSSNAGTAYKFEMCHLALCHSEKLWDFKIFLTT